MLQTFELNHLLHVAQCPKFFGTLCFGEEQADSEFGLVRIIYYISINVQKDLGH